ncbi:MAG: VanW family protein [Clostridia bacterium]|nr:VanW family protein [Clostridia bacterium]
MNQQKVRKGIQWFFYFFISIVLLCSCSSEQTRFEKTIKKDVVLENELVGGLKESEAITRLKDLASKIDKPSRDARLDEKKWVVVEREQIGRGINIEKTLSSLLNSNEGEKVQLVIEEKKPGITAEKLKSNIVEIASYSTPIVDRQEARMNNIELAAGKVNYKILMPGEEFSFNNTVGRRTEAKGYEEAPIIIKTEDGYEKGYGIGGGICQLATTIYNAAEKGNLEITERHLHSKKVGYVPKGKDATVSYGSVDLKFRNNRSHPVMIRTYVGNKSLTVKILENRNG